jgi:hypothetical protein
MNELDPRARALLGRARRAIAPPASEKARLGSMLAARLAADLGAPSGDEPSSAWHPPSPSRLLDGSKKVILAGAVMGTVGFGAGYWVGRTQPVRVEERRVVTVSAATASERAAEPVPGAPEPAVSFEQLSQEHNSRAGAPSASAAPSSSGTLAEEVRMLEEAQAALRSGDSLVALALLRRLDQRFPRGELREERAAAEVLALCANDLSGEAVGRGRAFLAKYPHSVYAARVRAACAPETSSDE